MDDTRQLIVLNNNDNRDQQTKLSTTVPTKSRITNNDISKQISSDTELKILTQNEYIQLNKRKLTKTQSNIKIIHSMNQSEDMCNTKKIT